MQAAPCQNIIVLHAMYQPSLAGVFTDAIRHFLGFPEGVSARAMFEAVHRDADTYRRVVLQQRVCLVGRDFFSKLNVENLFGSAVFREGDGGWVSWIKERQAVVKQTMEKEQQQGQQQGQLGQGQGREGQGALAGSSRSASRSGSGDSSNDTYVRRGLGIPADLWQTYKTHQVGWWADGGAHSLGCCQHLCNLAWHAKQAAAHRPHACVGSSQITQLSNVLAHEYSDHAVGVIPMHHQPSGACQTADDT